MSAKARARSGAKPKKAGAKQQAPAHPVRQARTSRFEARLSEDTKALFQQAADLRGETLTDFVLAASREKAVETLQEAQLVRLGAEDQRRFVEALLNPSEPSLRLRDAAERYRRVTR